MKSKINGIMITAFVIFIIAMALYVGVNCSAPYTYFSAIALLLVVVFYPFYTIKTLSDKLIGKSEYSPATTALFLFLLVSTVSILTIELYAMIYTILASIPNDKFTDVFYDSAQYFCNTGNPVKICLTNINEYPGISKFWIVSEQIIGYSLIPVYISMIFLMLSRGFISRKAKV